MMIIIGFGNQFKGCKIFLQQQNLGTHAPHRLTFSYCQLTVNQEAPSGAIMKIDHFIDLSRHCILYTKLIS